MTFDAPLPGFAPALLRLDLMRRTDGGFVLRVTATDDARFLHRDDATEYLLDSWGEVLDVAGACLDAYDLDA